jgi:hypothetical protein
MFVYLLIPICVITVFFIIKEKRFEKLSLIDESKSPFGDIQRVLGSVKKVWDDIANGVGGVGEAIKKAFEPKGAYQRECVNSWSNWVGDCMGHVVNREDDRNDSEPLGAHHSPKNDGCSWNRHPEGVKHFERCFRSCPKGFFGRADERCWTNGADSHGVVTKSADRWTCPPHDHPRHTKIVGLLCYVP